MLLPHSTVEVEKPALERFKTAEFESTCYAVASIKRESDESVTINIPNGIVWGEQSLEQLASFCRQMAAQLRLEKADQKE